MHSPNPSHHHPRPRALLADLRPRLFQLREVGLDNLLHAGIHFAEKQLLHVPQGPSPFSLQRLLGLALQPEQQQQHTAIREAPRLVPREVQRGKAPEAAALRQRQWAHQHLFGLNRRQGKRLEGG